jgi:flagellar basal body P-ring formation protein FlgA
MNRLILNRFMNDVENRKKAVSNSWRATFITLPSSPLFLVVVSTPRLFLSLLLCVQLISFPKNTLAFEIQGQEEIRELAERFLEEHSNAGEEDVEIEAATLDSRLNLPLCSSNMSAFLPVGRSITSNSLVGVRCNGSRPWTIYIPVRVRKFGNVLIARHSLVRGTRLDSDNIEIKRRELSTINGTPIADISHASGLITRRAMAKGTIITEIQLQRSLAIKRGEQVTIIADLPGLAVRTPGKALADGAQGKTIPVRNLLSKKIIYGVIEQAGMIRVRL